MGSQHIRLYQEVHPISVDSECSSSGNNFGRSRHNSKINTEAHSDALGQLNNGYIGISSPCNRRAQSWVIKKEAPLSRWLHHFKNNVQAYCWPIYLSNYCPVDPGLYGINLPAWVCRQQRHSLALPISPVVQVEKWHSGRKYLQWKVFLHQWRYRLWNCLWCHQQLLSTFHHCF